MFDYLRVNWLEWFGVVTGLLYLYYEIKQNSRMWVVGFISSLVYVYVFWIAKIYADSLLYFYYVVMSIYGFVCWRKMQNGNLPDESNSSVSFVTLNRRLITQLSATALLLFLFISQILTRFTDSPIPYSDALNSALSIIATWMVAKKFIEHWFVWIFINLLSVFLCYSRGLYPTSFLFFAYSFLSVYGYYSWRRVPVAVSQSEKINDR